MGLADNGLSRDGRCRETAGNLAATILAAGTQPWQKGARMALIGTAHTDLGRYQATMDLLVSIAKGGKIPMRLEANASLRSG